jgi:hypothetical protein
MGNILLQFFLASYIQYVGTLIFNKNSRIYIKQKNKQLDKLREVKVKTLQEQKQFIDLKYRKKTGKFVFTWKWFFTFILSMFKFIVIMYILNLIFMYFNIMLKLSTAILIIIIFPILVNLVLSKFKLEKDSLLIMFK